MDPVSILKVAEPTREEVDRKCIALLQAMPPDCDPFENVRNQEKKIMQSVAEDAKMRDMMKDQLTFFTYTNHLHKSVPSHILQPSNSSQALNRFKKHKSAPTTPIQAKLELHQEIDQIALPPSPKKPKLSIIPEEANTNTNPAFDILYSQSTTLQLTSSDFFRIDHVYGHLQAAIEYEKVHEMVKLALQGKWNKGPEHPLLLVRTLCKKSMELLDLLVITPELDIKYWDIVDEAVQTGAKIQNAFGSNCQPTECSVMSDLVQTGIDYVAEKCVKFIVDERKFDTEVCIGRGELVNGIIEGTKSVKVRHLLLGKLLLGLNSVCTRFAKALDFNHEPNMMMKLEDINGAFVYLQLIEYILVTTGKEKWIETSLWEGLRLLEEKLEANMLLGQLSMFVGRQVVLAKPLVLFPPDQDDLDLDASFGAASIN